jgi:anti-sigma factor RsiW
MNQECERALLALDEGLDVRAHLEGCPDCRAEAELRELLRTRLAEAVRREPVDPALERRVRASMVAPGFRAQWQAYAAAAVVLIAVGGYWGAPWVESRYSENAYFQVVPESVSRIMRVGLLDHVHCAVFRKLPKPAPVAEVVRELPARYQPLALAVRERIPKEFLVLAAHECMARGRRFIHVVMKNPEGKTVSLILARKEAGETFANSPLRNVGGVFVESAPRFAMAGFEAGAYLAFVISDLDLAANEQLAGLLVEPVRRWTS